MSLENITTDVHDLEKGMEQVRKEFELRGKEKNNTVLHDFLKNAEEKLRRLKSEAKSAGDAFHACVEFFGESPRQADANSFFSLLVRFARAFKVCLNKIFFKFESVILFYFLRVNFFLFFLDRLRIRKTNKDEDSR